MRVVIIEDEELAAEKLERLIKEIDQDIVIMDKLDSVKGAVKWLSGHKPDLIFLDIQLSDGLSFSIFEMLPVNIPIIFTTAYDEYALRAFQLNSIDYLLKPIKKEDLQKSLSKYRLMKTTLLPDIDNLLKTINEKATGFKKRFLIKFGQKIKKVESGEAALFYAIEKNVFLVTFDNSVYPVDYSLDKLEEIMDPEIFFRINRKIIINSNAIKQMIPYSKSRIKIDLSVNLPKEIEALVSVERSPRFKEWLDK